MAQTRRQCEAYLKKDSGAEVKERKYVVFQCKIRGCENKTPGVSVCDEHLDFSLTRDNDHHFQCRNEVWSLFSSDDQKYCQAHRCSEYCCEKTRSVGKRGCSIHTCCVDQCPDIISSSDWVGVIKACNRHQCDLCHTKPHLPDSTRCQDCWGRCGYYMAQGSYKAWCGRAVVPGRGHCKAHQCKYQRGLVQCIETIHSEYSDNRMRNYCGKHQEWPIQPWKREDEARETMTQVLIAIREDVAFWPGKKRAVETKEHFDTMLQKIIT